MAEPVALVKAGWEALSAGLKAYGLYDKYLSRRRERIREAFIEELRDGKIDFASEDDFCETVVRLEQAAFLGAGRANLRIMARVLRGLSEQKPIYASEFVRYERAVADLSREELIVVTVLLHESRDGGRSVSDAWKATEDALVPQTFSTKEDMRGTAFAAQRTGLLMNLDSIDAIGYLTPTPLLREIGALISLDESLWNDRA